MIKPALPPDEAMRLSALRSYRLLDTEPEPIFDQLTALAATVAETPTALISLIDEDRQWFKSRVGLDVAETSRDIAFCAHTILGPDPLIVNDATQDHRFARNPLVTGGIEIRFYAGFPLSSPGGQRLGTLCVLGPEPGGLAPQQEAVLATLAVQIQIYFEMRRDAARGTRRADTGIDDAFLEVTNALEGLTDAHCHLAAADLSVQEREHLTAGQHAADHLAYVLDDLHRRIQTSAREPQPTQPVRIDLRS